MCSRIKVEKQGRKAARRQSCTPPRANGARAHAREVCLLAKSSTTDTNAGEKSLLQKDSQEQEIKRGCRKKKEQKGGEGNMDKESFGAQEKGCVGLENRRLYFSGRNELTSFRWGRIISVMGRD